MNEIATILKIENTQTALILFFVSVTLFILLYFSDSRDQKKLQDAEGNEREIRVPFYVWSLNPNNGDNMEEVMESYEERYASTFTRLANESKDRFLLRNRIEYLQSSLKEFDPEIKKGVENLISIYRMRLSMLDVSERVKQ